MLIILRTLVLVISLFSVVSLQAKPLENILKPLLAKQADSSTLGMVVMDARSGKVLYDYHSHQVLSPASNTKLFSAVAALYGLGADYQFKTTLKAQLDPVKLNQAQNVVFEFSGDPSLTRADLRELIHQLAEQKITEISQDILIDDRRFEAPDYAPGTSYEDLAYYYAAPVNSVILDGNAVELTLIPNKEIGQPVKVELAEDQQWIVVQSNVRTVSPQEVGKSCDLQVTVGSSNQIRLNGCIAQADEPRHERIVIASPQARVASFILAALHAEGIHLKGHIRVGYLNDTKVVAVHKSAPLLTLMTHMLKHSDNLYADAFLKTMGAEKSGVGNYLTGVAAMKEILSAHTPVNFSNLQLSDGAGTRFNLMAPYSIAQLLQAVYKDKKFQTDFMSALPIAGVDGSLQNRFNNSAVKEHLFAKTGSMHDVSSLSGYIETKKGNTLIFSIISNNVLGGTKETKRLEEALCDAIYQAG